MDTLDPEARLSTYFEAPGEPPDEVTGKDIRATLKAAAVALNYEERGIPTNRVDTHSLRAVRRRQRACAKRLLRSRNYEDGTLAWRNIHGVYLRATKLLQQRNVNSDEQALSLG